MLTTMLLMRELITTQLKLRRGKYARFAQTVAPGACGFG